MDKKIWTLEDDMKFRDMCLEGRSNIEIADEFNVTVKAVYHHRAKMRLTMREIGSIKAKNQHVTEGTEQKRDKEIAELKLEIRDLKGQVSTNMKLISTLNAGLQDMYDVFAKMKSDLMTTEHAALTTYNDLQYVIEKQRPLKRLRAPRAEDPVCIQELRELTALKYVAVCEDCDDEEVSDGSGNDQHA